MMKNTGFYMVGRMGLEDDPGSIGSVKADVLNVIRDIEAKAAVLRNQGKDPRVELASEINDLQSRMFSTNQRESEYFHSEVQRLKKDYEADLVKNPELENMRINKAKLRINSMTEKELTDLKINGDFNVHEMQLMQAKLKTDDGHDSTLTASINEGKIDKPYLDTDAKRELLDNANDYGSRNDMLVIDGGRIPVARLVDLDNEMGQEEP